MFEKRSVGLDEALGAIHAMIHEIRNNPQNYWQAACMAVVDEAGKLVAFAKMDSQTQMAQDIAIRKAWTAAMWRRDIQEVQTLLEDVGFTMEDFLQGGTMIPGGVAIIAPSDPGMEMSETELAKAKGLSAEEVAKSYGKTPIGAIGVSAAGPWQRDLEVARVGLQYIQQNLWANND
jgi:uncharacterized protein GlcG (DUF336 family)